jgi:hypothetical protein
VHRNNILVYKSQQVARCFILNLCGHTIATPGVMCVSVWGQVLFLNFEAGHPRCVNLITRYKVDTFFPNYTSLPG